MRASVARPVRRESVIPVRASQRAAARRRGVTTARVNPITSRTARASARLGRLSFPFRGQAPACGDKRNAAKRRNISATATKLETRDMTENEPGRSCIAERAGVRVFSDEVQPARDRLPAGQYLATSGPPQSKR
jgi:hypothetical protein